MLMKSVDFGLVPLSGELKILHVVKVVRRLGIRDEAYNTDADTDPTGGRSQPKSHGTDADVGTACDRHGLLAEAIELGIAAHALQPVRPPNAHLIEDRAQISIDICGIDFDDFDQIELTEQLALDRTFLRIVRAAMVDKAEALLVHPMGFVHSAGDENDVVQLVAIEVAGLDCEIGHDEFLLN
jgi:hypothetical protein